MLEKTLLLLLLFLLTLPQYRASPAPSDSYQ